MKESASNEVLLKVDKLSKYFLVKRGLWGPTFTLKAVDKVTLELRKRESISLVGESGSGKTTLGRTILRLEEPNGGRIIFEGKDITHTPVEELKWYRRSASLVQQDPYGAMPSHFTIARILEEPLMVHGIEPREERLERVYKALEQVRLTPVEDFAHKYPHMLSGGQLQRVAIARALILNPKLIIADEPVSMLDASVRIEILYLLQELQDKLNLSFIYITHDLATTRYFSQWIYIMYAGHIVERGPVDKVLRNPLHPYTVALLNAIPDPDPENRKRFREVPPGEPPSLINPPNACRFAPRCPKAMERCHKEEPVEVEIEHNHWVKCWLYEP